MFRAKPIELQSSKVEGSRGRILRERGRGEVQTTLLHLVRDPYHESKQTNLAGQRRC